MTLKEFFESPQLLAINLKTKEQVDVFSKEADKLGKKWGSGISYVEYTFWDEYREETCYTNRGCFAGISHYANLDESRQCKVLNFEEIEWEELKMDNFTKKDIKNGAVVELRDGGRYLKVDDTILSLDMSGDFMPLQKYDNNLNCILSGAEEFDIMKVLNPKENKENENCCNLALCNIKEKDVNWTWEREEKKKIKLKDMTFEQYDKWTDKHCRGTNCKSCIFYKVPCGEWRNDCWINNKELYNENFLNQEVELGEIDNA